MVVNPSATTIEVSTPITYRGESMTELFSGASASLPARIELPAYGYAVYVK